MAPRQPESPYLTDPFSRKSSAIDYFSIRGIGFDELEDDIDLFEKKWDDEAAKILAEAARRLRKAAQPRSPYLYGVLRGAHFDTLIEDSSFWNDQAGLVAIDPSVWHPILGGQPNIYGAEIHAGLKGPPRPWFAWTIEQEGASIIEESGGDLIGVYSKYINRVMF